MLSLTGINLQTKSVIECRNKIFCFNYLIFILAHFFVGICGVDVIATERILSYLSECNNVEYKITQNDNVEHQFQNFDPTQDIYPDSST